MAQFLVPSLENKLILASSRGGNGGGGAVAASASSPREKGTIDIFIPKCPYFSFNMI